MDCNYIGWVSYLQQTYPALDSHIGISVGPRDPMGSPCPEKAAAVSVGLMHRSNCRRRSGRDLDYKMEHIMEYDGKSWDT